MKKYKYEGLDYIFSTCRLINEYLLILQLEKMLSMRKYIFFLLVMLCANSVLFAQEDKGKKGTKKNNKTEENAVQGDEAQAAVSSVVGDGQDDESDNGNFVPGLLHSSSDVYANNTSYTFSIAYFRARGYDNKYQEVFANGFDMNNMVTGRANYSQWGGLNNIFRYPESITNMNVATFDFGEIGGASNYNLRASNFRRQLRTTYSLTNRTYNNRIMITGSTGLTKNGWAFTGSLSTRFGNNISYVKGTSYNGFGLFLAGEKKINSEHWLNLAGFASYIQRGMQSNSVQEAYDLLGDNYYNANWGWYQGKMRNARVRSQCEPTILLTHTFAPTNNKLSVQTTIGTSFGFNNTTSLNWYDAPDPRPDYYRYLPSYQIDNGDTSGVFNDIVNLWTSNDESYTQINWDNLYNVNLLAAEQGKRAQYMVENRRYDQVQGGISSILNWSFSEHWDLYAGYSFRGMQQHNYKTIEDLLGGAYWIDVDKYSEGDFPEDQNVQYNDLLHKDDTLHEGDVFGYDYKYNIFQEKIWGVVKGSYNHWDLNFGLKLGASQLWRTGNMQNGRFQENSLGKSALKNNIDYGARLGVTYKINGRNYIVLNGMGETRSPNVLNSFLSPRINNNYVKGLANEKILSGDLSYVLNYPVIKMRVTAFLTQIYDATRLISFYHDDYSTMVNYAISNIDQRHLGVEAGAEIKLGSMFSLILAGTWGDYRYTDRANVAMNAENGTDFEGEMEGTVYWKNFHVAGTPQVAATTGLKFNYNYWWVNINANYFDKIYCDINPERRTSAARGSLDENSELYHQVVDQTRLKGQLTLDLSVSKSWRIQRKYTIGFNASITNLLNNKKLVTTAWEQYRFDYTNYNVNKYANKYYYAFGTTFYLGVYFNL